MQVVVAHLLNAANTNREDTNKLLTWVASEKERFNRENPKAPSILAGDLNAAQNTWLDTDRKGVNPGDNEQEPDAEVLAVIKRIKYHDIIRTRHPTARLVTRAITHQTNRLLDRWDGRAVQEG